MNQESDFKVEELNGAAPASLVFVPATGRTLPSGRARGCFLAPAVQTPLSLLFPAAESFCVFSFAFAAVMLESL